MDDEDFDVFDLLKKNGLFLALHMINIIKDLGYNDIRTLAQVEGAECLEAAVIESFSKDEEYLKLSDEKKKEVLGPKCWKSPSTFKFQAGEGLQFLPLSLYALSCWRRCP